MLTEADAGASFSGGAYTCAGMALGDYNGDGTQDLAIGSMSLNGSHGGSYMLYNVRQAKKPSVSWVTFV